MEFWWDPGSLIGMRTWSDDRDSQVWDPKVRKSRMIKHLRLRYDQILLRILIDWFICWILWLHGFIIPISRKYYLTLMVYISVRESHHHLFLKMYDMCLHNSPIVSNIAQLHVSFTSPSSISLTIFHLDLSSFNIPTMYLLVKFRLINFSCT